MRYCFYIFPCLFLVILQSTIIPYFGFLDNSYDLLTPFIIYLGLYCSVGESLPILILLGFIMDNLSTGPLGLYITAYFWLFVGVKWIIKFLHVGNIFLLPIVMVSGIIIETSIFLGTFATLDPGFHISESIINTVLSHLFWAVCTGPFFIIIYRFSHKKWNKWFHERFAERGREYGE